MFWPPVFVTQTAGNNNLKGRKKKQQNTLAENKPLFLIFSAKNPKRNTGYSTDAKFDSLDAQKWRRNRRIHDLTVIFSIRSVSISESGVRKCCVITTTLCLSAACWLQAVIFDVTRHNEQSSCCRSSISDVSVFVLQVVKESLWRPSHHNKSSSSRFLLNNPAFCLFVA